MNMYGKKMFKKNVTMSLFSLIDNLLYNKAFELKNTFQENSHFYKPNFAIN